jgi:hypothetical protein
MANQLKMADIQAILALHQHGWSARRIARELDVHRETVGHYVSGAAAQEPKPASAPPGVLAAPMAPERRAGSRDDDAGDSKPASAPSGSEGGIEAEASKPASAPAGLPGAPSGVSAVNGSNASAALPWREVIVQKLEEGLSAQRIYQDLTNPDQGHGYDGSYYSVRRLIQKLSGGTARCRTRRGRGCPGRPRPA